MTWSNFTSNYLQDLKQWSRAMRTTATTTLETRRLGTTDLEITTVGFGAWAIGGGGWAYGWGPQDDESSIAAIRHAVDGGINWIDTAAIYGLGHSEEVVGRALREIPAADRPHIFTKGGMVPDRARPYEDPQRNLKPDSIRRELEASLRRLGVEQIDLYDRPSAIEKIRAMPGLIGVWLKDMIPIRAAGGIRLGNMAARVQRRERNISSKTALMRRTACQKP